MSATDYPLPARKALHASIDTLADKFFAHVDEKVPTTEAALAAFREIVAERVTTAELLFFVGSLIEVANPVQTRITLAALVELALAARSETD